MPHVYWKCQRCGHEETNEANRFATPCPSCGLSRWLDKPSWHKGVQLSLCWDQASEDGPAASVSVEVSDKDTVEVIDGFGGPDAIVLTIDECTYLYRRA